MNDGAKKGDFLGQEKLILGHNVTNYGLWDKQGDFWGQENMILSHNETNYGTKQGDFWDRRIQYYVITR
jgi:hypothetical protein